MDVWESCVVVYEIAWVGEWYAVCCEVLSWMWGVEMGMRRVW